MFSTLMFKKSPKKTLENTLELTIKNLTLAYLELKNSTEEEEPKDSLLFMITKNQ
jgi:hypothetical protein